MVHAHTVANTHNWTRTLTCNDIITHVQANNCITALQLQHYQRQTSSSLYSPCQRFCRPMHLMSVSWFVSELSCQRVVLSASWLSASWFVSELSCQRVDCQRVGLSARCLFPERTSSPLLLICATLVLLPRCDTSEGLASILQKQRNNAVYHGTTVKKEQKKKQLEMENWNKWLIAVVYGHLGEKPFWRQMFGRHGWTTRRLGEIVGDKTFEQQMSFR